MTGLALLNKSGHKFRLSLAIAVASFLWTITLQTRDIVRRLQQDFDIAPT
jgi:hypothetical protein